MARELSLITLYTKEIYPRLTAAGFTGKVGDCRRTRGRGFYYVFASGKRGELDIRLEGSRDGTPVPPLIRESLRVAPGGHSAAIARLDKQVIAALARIDALDAAEAVPVVATLAEALEALLARKEAKHGAVGLDRVQASGRNLLVHRGGGRAAITTDPTALLTLLHALWGDKAFRKNVDPRWELRDAEVGRYLDLLAVERPDDARALHVHLFSPYMTFAPEPGAPASPLAALFPEPVWAATHLNRAGSWASLIARALPHAEAGALVDRIAALSVIQIALDDASFTGKHATLGSELRALSERLRTDPHALVREAGWLLDRALPPVAPR